MNKVLIILLFGISFRIGKVKNASSASRIPQFAGPVKFAMKQIDPCPKEMLGQNLHTFHGIVKQTRDKPGRRFYGYFESKEPLDDSIEMRGNIASWSQGGGWTPNAYFVRFDKICTGLKTYFLEAMEMMEHHSSSGIKFCPRGVSNFTIEAAPVSSYLKRFPVFQYGKWRADFSYYHKNQLVGCTRFFFDTVPVVH